MIGLDCISLLAIIASYLDHTFPDFFDIFQQVAWILEITINNRIDYFWKPPKPSPLTVLFNFHELLVLLTGHFFPKIVFPDIEILKMNSIDPFDAQFSLKSVTYLIKIFFIDYVFLDLVDIYFRYSLILWPNILLVLKQWSHRIMIILSCILADLINFIKFLWISFMEWLLVFKII